MRQRVELARALAGETDLLLMDEPFSSLDYLTRLRLRGELARLLREQPRTVVLVTHDIEEAAQLADRVLVLSERPARVRDEVRLDAPRPRDLTHPAVVQAVHRILTELGLEQDRPVPLPRHTADVMTARVPRPWSPDAAIAVRPLDPGCPRRRARPGRAAPAAVADRAAPAASTTTAPRDAGRRLPAGDLSPHVSGHRLRDADQPLHALRVAALHRLPDGRRDAEERPAATRPS